MHRKFSRADVNAEPALHKRAGVARRKRDRIVDRNRERMPFRTDRERMHAAAEIERSRTRNADRAAVAVIILFERGPKCRLRDFDA